MNRSSDTPQSSLFFSESLPHPTLPPPPVSFVAPLFYLGENNEQGLNARRNAEAVHHKMILDAVLKCVRCRKLKSNLTSNAPHSNSISAPKQNPTAAKRVTPRPLKNTNASCDKKKKRVQRSQDTRAQQRRPALSVNNNGGGQETVCNLF